MTVGSLFAGVGGFDLGFERAGFEIRWQVEIDPFCRGVLARHWPDVPCYEDVHTVGVNLEDVDVICGGFPCQDLSSAGKRAGINGTRSGLWRQFIRVVCIKRPRCVVIENVAHAWRSWVPVLRRALWQLGYASLPLRLRACDFGAWHERSRVFLVAHVDPSVLRLESWRRSWPFWPDAPLFTDVAAERFGAEGGTLSGEHRSWRWPAAEANATDADSPGCQNGEGSSADAGLNGERSTTADLDALRELQPEGRIGDIRGWTRDGGRWAIEPDVVRVVHGLSSRLDGRRMSARIAALGNAVVPEPAEWIAERILHAEGVRA